MSIFTNNIAFLIKVSGVKQKFIAESIGVSEATISKWTWGRTPQKKTLVALSRFFAETLNIPYELFEDGQALLEKDFENIYDNYQLGHKKELHFKNNNSTFRKHELSELEREFIFKLRHIIKDSDVIPLDPHYLELALQCHAVMGRDERLMQSFIDVINALSKK